MCGGVQLNIGAKDIGTNSNFAPIKNNTVYIEIDISPQLIL
jgi:hypothetical protein